MNFFRWLFSARRRHRAGIRRYEKGGAGVRVLTLFFMLLFCGIAIGLELWSFSAGKENLLVGILVFILAVIFCIAAAEFCLISGKYDEALEEKPRWIVLNKIDLVPEEERAELIETYRRELAGDRPLFVMSAATREGTAEIVKAIAETLGQMRAAAHAVEDAERDVRFAEDRGEVDMASESEDEPKA